MQCNAHVRDVNIQFRTRTMVKRQRVKFIFLSLVLTNLVFADVLTDYRAPPAPWFQKFEATVDDAVRRGTRTNPPENFPPTSTTFWQCFVAVLTMTDDDLLIAVGAVICDERHTNQHQRPPVDSGIIAAD